MTTTAEPAMSPSPRSKQSPNEQEALAMLRIARGMSSAATQGLLISAGTARLIAASLHSGPESHLARFAATGMLLPTEALQELETVSPAPVLPTWFWALNDFIEDVQAQEPDVDDHVPRPHPLVFVEVSDPESGDPICGRWVKADVRSSELQEKISEVTSDGIYRGPARLTATIGFLGIELPEDATAWEISEAANNVAAFGEAYALLANHLGFQLTADDFQQTCLGVVLPEQDGTESSAPEDALTLHGSGASYSYVGVDTVSPSEEPL